MYHSMPPVSSLVPSYGKGAPSMSMPSIFSETPQSKFKDNQTDR